jgi:general secretion pathway protein G
MKITKNRSEKGFTLVEIIIVLAIIGLIMAIVGPRLIEQFDKSKSVTAKAQAKSIESAVISLQIDIGRYPTNAEGLTLLLKPSADVVESWQGPYLSSDVPADPWGRPYIYREPESEGLRPTIGTLGSDGVQGGTGAAKDIFIGDNKNASKPS